MYLYRKGMSYKLFTFYLVYVLAVETGFHVLRNMYVNNIFLAHYYFIGQAVLLNLFYFRLLESGRLKRMQLITTAVLSMAVIVNIAIRKHNNETFDLLEVVLCNTSVVVCMLLYLYDRIDKQKIYYLSTASLLAYTIASTIIFVSANLIISLRSPAYTRYIWTLNIILFVLLQLVILYDAVKSTRKPIPWVTK